MLTSLIVLIFLPLLFIAIGIWVLIFLLASSGNSNREYGKRVLDSDTLLKRCVKTHLKTIKKMDEIDRKQECSASDLEAEKIAGGRNERADKPFAPIYPSLE